jgi:hypothetical protein
MRLSRIVLFAVLACCACTHDYAALMGNSGAGGTTARGGAGGSAHGGAGGTAQAGRGGSSAGGSIGSAGSGGSTGAQGGSAGASSSAGADGRGGVGGSGGTTGTAGASGTSGSTCGATFGAQANGFVTVPAQGACWHGYAYVGGDAGSTISPPSFGSCGTPCMLKMTGTVGPATVANSYSGNAYLGFNVSQDASGTTAAQIVPTGTSVTFTFTAATAGLALRAQLNSGGSTFWCYTITGSSPVTIPYTAFNTACWDNSGTAYAKQPIQSVGFSVPGGATATSINVTLTSVKEN